MPGGGFLSWGASTVPKNCPVALGILQRPLAAGQELSNPTEVGLNSILLDSILWHPALLHREKGAVRLAATMAF